MLLASLLESLWPCLQDALSQEREVSGLELEPDMAEELEPDLGVRVPKKASEPHHLSSHRVNTLCT